MGMHCESSSKRYKEGPKKNRQIGAEHRKMKM